MLMALAGLEYIIVKVKWTETEEKADASASLACSLEQKITNALKIGEREKKSADIWRPRRPTQRGLARRALQTSALTPGYSPVFFSTFEYLSVCPGGIWERPGASNSSGGVHLPAWIPWPLLPIMCSWLHQVICKQSNTTCYISSRVVRC